MKDNQKHLTLSDRIIIERGLNERKTFTAIAALIGKDPSTISKEIRKHRTLKQRKDPIKCAFIKTCTELIYVKMPFVLISATNVLSVIVYAPNM